MVFFNILSQFIALLDNIDCLKRKKKHLRKTVIKQNKIQTNLKQYILDCIMKMINSNKKNKGNDNEIMLLPKVICDKITKAHFMAILEKYPILLQEIQK